MSCEESKIAIPDLFSELPSSDSASLPYLSKSDDGALLYLWVESSDSLTSLYFSKYDGSRWAAKKEIDSGTNWFVNWADYPSITDLGEGALMVHYLEKSGDGKYAYDVKLIGSKDGGSTWGEAFSPHTDGTETEHGFVSIVASGSKQADVVWLDGRNYVEGGSKNMTLRSARVNTDGLLEASQELDDRICDCCSTSLISQNGRALAYYRDRSDSEIRDISRVALNSPLQSSDVSQDNWEIAGCPVNGPRASVYDQTLHALAWFTGANGNREVLLKFDRDGILSQKYKLDKGSPLGRVDLDWIDEKTVLVSWMEETAEDQAQIMLRRIEVDGQMAEPQVIADVSSSRGTGVPQLEILKGQAFVAWTNTDSKNIEIRKIPLPKN